MKNNKIGLIRVITLEDKDKIDNHGKIIKGFCKADGKTDKIEIVSRCIPEQYFGIHDDETLKAGVPKIIKMAKEMEEEGFDAVVISCCADPAFKEVKAAVKIPVISAGNESTRMAASKGAKVGAIGITEVISDNIKDILENRLFKYVRPEGIESTVDLTFPQGKAAVVAAAEKMHQDGADCILLCCTGMANAGIAQVLREKIDIPVIDPLESVAERIESL